MQDSSNSFLGKYQLLSRLGTTGLASVFLAIDTNTKNTFALKVLHSYFSKQTDRTEILNQTIQKVTNLNHANIVRVHDITEIENHTVIVMDYLDWPNLKIRDMETLPVKEVARILTQVSEGIEYAHSNGIIHRDIRPSNIFYNPVNGKVAISDFAAVPLLENSHALLTSTINTPAPNYTSPEQIQGTPPHPQNDVYAMGTLAYELLVGFAPFEALNPITLLSEQLSVTPTPPSEINTSLPEEIDEIILKAIESDPKRRYESPKKFSDALADAASRLPDTSPTPISTITTDNESTPITEHRVAAQGTTEQDTRICRHCGSHNPYTATRCLSCWGSIDKEALVTRAEAEAWVSRYINMLRRRKRVTIGIISTVSVLLLALWTYNIFDIRPPLPSPSTSISSNPMDENWAVFRQNILHTGSVPGADPSPTGRTKWKFESNGPLMAVPVIDNDRVFIATSDRRVVSLDKRTGDVIWTYPVNGPVNSSPALAGNSVFVGLRDGTLLALNSETGELNWEYDVGGAIYGSATIIDGVAYVGSAGYSIHALDAQTGVLRWERSTEYGIYATPTIDLGIFIVGSQAGELYMLDAGNGTLRYQIDIGSAIDSTTSIVNNIGYTTNRTGRVIAFDYTEKDVAFRKGLNRIKLHLYVWNMISHPPRTPGLIWSTNLKDQNLGNLAIANGRVFASTVSGKLYALDKNTGSIIWEATDLPRIFASPIVSGNTVIQSTSSGAMYGFDVTTGKEKWQVQLNEPLSISPIISNGILYVPTDYGNLYAME